jgi:hypothetical protein
MLASPVNNLLQQARIFLGAARYAKQQFRHSYNNSFPAGARIAKKQAADMT